MSKRNWRLFLDDTLKSAVKILKYTDGMERRHFFSDDKTFDAVMRNLTIIGKAVKNIPDGIRNKHNAIEWKKIAGLKDIVMHEYFGIDEDIIWDVVKYKIPDFKLQIEMIIKETSL